MPCKLFIAIIYDLYKIVSTLSVSQQIRTGFAINKTLKVTLDDEGMFWEIC